METFGWPPIMAVRREKNKSSSFAQGKLIRQIVDRSVDGRADRVSLGQGAATGRSKVEYVMLLNTIQGIQG